MRVPHFSVPLREPLGRRETLAFEEAMSRMANDPAIQAECIQIDKEFSDGGTRRLNRSRTPEIDL
jgi:hypothetical protein